MNEEGIVYLVCDASEEDSGRDDFWCGCLAPESMQRKCLCAFHFLVCSERRRNAKQLKALLN